MTVLDRADVILSADDRQLDRVLAGAAQKMQRAGQRMQAIGRTLSTRVTLPLAAAGAAAVKMATDAEESANKFDVVFGDAAESVRTRLQDLTNTVPLTTAEMETLASQLQDMLVPMGVARSEAAGMSGDFIELAGDIGSFNNVATGEVLEAFQSALAGMSRPLRRFGIDTREGRLETLALEEGLISAGQEMNETARAQAVMIAIQRDSTDAMGDAARTVDSTANSFRFLLRDVKQVGEDIGRVLIPAVRPMVNRLRDLVGILGDLSPRTQRWAVTIAGVTAAAGPLLIVLGSLARAMSALAVTSIAQAFVGWTTAVVGLIPAVNSLSAALGLAQAALGPAGWVVLGVGTIVSGFGLWKAATSDQVDALDELQEALDGSRERFNELNLALLRQVRAGLQARNVAEQVIEGFQVVVETPIPKAMERLADSIDLVRRKALALAGTGFDAVAQRASLVRDAIVDLIEQAVDPANARIQELRRQLIALESDPEPGPLAIPEFSDEDGMRPFVGLENVGETAQATFRRVSENAQAAGDRMAGVARSVQSNFGNAFASLVTGSQSFGQAFGDVAQSILADLARMIGQALALRAILAAIPGFGGLFSGFGGFFQGGGAVAARTPIVVGEAGPELFVPSTAGRVVPNDELSGASLSLSVSVPPATNPLAVSRDRDWLEALQLSIQELESRGGG